MRKCIDDVIGSGEDYCEQQLDDCFDSKECSEEFTELFKVCEVPEDENAYTGSICMRQQSSKIQLVLTQELIDCLDKNCGLLETISTDSNEKHANTTPANLTAEQKKREEEDNFYCLYMALKEEEQCAKDARECDDYCLTELQQIRECFLQDQCKKGDKIMLLINELQDERARSLAFCIVKYCKF